MSKSRKIVEKPTLTALYRTYKGICQITGKKIRKKDAAIEHILPKSKGGSDDWTNVVLVSKECLGQANVFTGTGPMTGKTIVAARMRDAFSFDELKVAERRFGGFQFRPKKP
jgi:5-methylcytosine-specific restriction endonuclease McrA